MSVDHRPFLEKYARYYGVFEMLSVDKMERSGSSRVRKKRDRFQN